MKFAQHTCVFFRCSLSPFFLNSSSNFSSSCSCRCFLPNRPSFSITSYSLPRPIPPFPRQCGTDYENNLGRQSLCSFSRDNNEVAETTVCSLQLHDFYTHLFSLRLVLFCLDVICSVLNRKFIRNCILLTLLPVRRHVNSHLEIVQNAQTWSSFAAFSFFFASSCFRFSASAFYIYERDRLKIRCSKGDML